MGHIKITRLELIALLSALVVMAGVLAFLYPEFSAIGTDGTAYAWLGESLFQGQGLSIFGQPHTIFSPLFPLLIAGGRFFTDNLEGAALGVNIFVALLSVVVFYFLLRSLTNRTTALIGLAAFTLNGHLVFSYLSAGPQPLTTLLGMLLIWLLFHLSYANPANSTVKNRLLFLASGIISGLLYLNRPEYFFLIIPILLYLAVIFRRLSFKRIMASLGLVSVGFLLLATPYLIFLKHQLGYWTVSGRSSAVALYVTNQYEGADIQGDNFITTLSGTERQSILGSVLANPGKIIKKAFKGLRDSERNFASALGIMTIGFFVLGLRRWILAKRFKELWLGLIWLSPLLAIVLAQGGSTNYLIQFFFFFLILAAVGLNDLVMDWQRSFPLTALAQRWWLGILTLIWCAHAFLPVPQNYLFTPRENFIREYEAAGRWLHEQIPDIAQATIFSRKPEVAFYAGAAWQETPHYKTVSQLIELMHQESIRYLVLDERLSAKEYPLLNSLLTPASAPHALLPLHTLEYAGHPVIIYQLN